VGSLIDIVEQSLLQPFAECLSECTFILQERQDYGEFHGSKYASNLFEKGQFL
jgi:hypothetical protein